MGNNNYCNNSRLGTSSFNRDRLIVLSCGTLKFLFSMSVFNVWAACGPTISDALLTKASGIHASTLLTKNQLGRWQAALETCPLWFDYLNLFIEFWHNSCLNSQTQRKQKPSQCRVKSLHFEEIAKRVMSPAGSVVGSSTLRPAISKQSK